MLEHIHATIRAEVNTAVRETSHRRRPGPLGRALWHAPVLVAGGPGGDDAWSTLRLAHDSIAAGVMFGPAAVPREAFQLYQLVWPPGRPVAEAVRERGGAKAAVASGGRPARLAGFDEDDVPAGITFRRSWLPPSPLDRAATERPGSQMHRSAPAGDRA
jgi:hypothetical protein